MNENVINEMMCLMETIMGDNFQMCMPMVLPKKKKNTIKKVKFDSRIKFSYYGDRGESSNHDGIITIASFINENSHAVHYGVSYCSPNDKYNKEFGKQLAVDNLRRYMDTVSLVRKNHHDINARIFANIIAMNNAPSWAQRMVAIELIIHLEKAFDVGI